MSNQRVIYEIKDKPVDIWTLDYMVLLKSRIKFPCSINQFSVMLDSKLLMKDSTIINNIIHQVNFNPLHTTFLKFSVPRNTNNGIPIWFLHVFIIRENGSIILNSLNELHKLICDITEPSVPSTDTEIPEGYNTELIRTLHQQPLMKLTYMKNGLEPFSLVEGFVDLTDTLPTPELL